MLNTTLVESIRGRTKLGKREYQIRIVSKSIAMFQGKFVNQRKELEPNARSVLIESPTGSGKTSMGWLAAKCLQHEIPDLVIGWVAMRRNLLSQAAAENASKGIHVSDAHMVSMFDKHPQALVEAKQAGRPLLLVIDEAQHDAANSAAHLHNLLEPDFILGLSATPFRTDRVKLCFDKVIKDAGIHALIQDGFLSPFHHYSIQNWNVQTVAETYMREPERWGKSIFYFKNLEECFECASILRGRGFVCDVVTGETDCESQLEAFRNGEIPALINCMKLTEGFDDPSLKTAFVRDSGKGCTMQMGGRVFRICDGLPHKQIVQSKNTRWPMIRTAMPQQQYVWQEDSWRSLTVNPKINLINHNARLAAAQIEVELPKFITRRRKVRKLRF